MRPLSIAEGVALQNEEIPYVPLKKGHPSSSYEVTFSLQMGVALQNGEIPYVPPKKGHPSYETTFSLQKGWPYKMGKYHTVI